jgi:hypothetical protein
VVRGDGAELVGQGVHAQTVRLASSVRRFIAAVWTYPFGYSHSFAQ